MYRSFKKIAAGVAAAAMVAGSLTGVMSVSAEEKNGMVRSYLTGKLVPESIGRTRPVAIMLNNIYDALPQSGIANAEVVYEAPVEGGITRLMGVFEDYQDVERIGSVRSCREYYVYFAQEFNAIYLHYGQAWYALELLWSDVTNNLSGLADAGYGEGDVTYYRVDDFPSPHNVYTNYDMIQAGIDYRGYSRDYSDSYTSQNGHYQFAEDDSPVLLEDGTEATYVSPGYTYNNAYFLYNAETGKYTRYQFGDTQIDKMTGRSLNYDNILIQYCSWTNYEDTDSYLNIDVLSGGSGKYITRGKAIDVTWGKDAANPADPFDDGNFQPTRYYDLDGNEITLNQGKTWVCIVLDTSADSVVIGTN